MKRQLRGALIHVLNGSGTARWKRRSSATIFCYHNVVSDTLDVVGGERMLHARQSEFAEQLEWIGKSFTVVPAGELIERMRRDRPIGGLAVLTFDDGYTGVVRHAVPLMRQMSFPFTIFPVIRGASERRPFWWDLSETLTLRQREHNVTALMGDLDLIVAEGLVQRDLPEEMLPASWAMLKSVLADDCTIGVHGVTHRSLAAIPPSEVEWELTGSRETIDAELGVRADIIAYPYGRSNSHVHAEAQRSGFQAAMGTHYGLVRPSIPLHNIARVPVPAGIPLSIFACWASGLKLPGG